MEHSSSFYTKLYGIPWERHSIFSVRVQTTHRPSGSRDTGKPASLASVAIPQQSRQESYGRFGRVQPFQLINDCLILYRQLNGNLVLVLVFIYYKHNSGLWSNSQMRFQFNYWEPFRRFDGVVLKCLWTCWPSQLCFRAVRQDRHRRLKVSVLPFASRCPVESVSQSVYRERFDCDRHSTSSISVYGTFACANINALLLLLVNMICLLLPIIIIINTSFCNTNIVTRHPLPEGNKRKSCST